MIPNHILIVGSPNSGKLRISDLIQSNTEVDRVESLVDKNSHCGTIHKTELTTKYYTIKLNILIDEYANCKDDESEEHKIKAMINWCDEFLSEEMEELREVLDGIIFTINVKEDSEIYINSQMDVIDKIRSKLDSNHVWPGFIAVVGSLPVGSNEDQYNSKFEEIEDKAITYGLEFINFQLRGKNEYKETQGKDRILELIESHEWSNMELIKSSTEMYESNKNEKLIQMSERLLQDDKEERTTPEHNDSLDKWFTKLTLARENAKNLSPSDREEYANEVIKELVDYI
ncbi:IRC6 [Candida pseudojiufengensis]|uniref:IRC6 n=1 Tax=Candida pseudojiufengensis TaxID=497109 RepID=UPI00222523D2|nr:IRC6 [Candida pseudojiufengensis]KAI5965665.1 IRC6 [Candida pseudojiufengensis]